MRKVLFWIAILPLLMPLFSGINPITVKKQNGKAFEGFYMMGLNRLQNELSKLDSLIRAEEDQEVSDDGSIQSQLQNTRLRLKEVDFFLRYAEPLLHKKINGPLPVEWETEVFEKYEKPYRRVGAGLALLTEYLEEGNPSKDSLLALLHPSHLAINGFLADSIKEIWFKPEPFFLANRLFLLNLASIYTTGFDCPDRNQILPELKAMLASMMETYVAFNHSFPSTPFSKDYLDAFRKLQYYVEYGSSDEIDSFDHYAFIKYHVNPLYAINQKLCSAYKIKSSSMVDYSLNPESKSIFDKNLFYAQDPKGIYNRVADPKLIRLIDTVGELLFFDPILSGNNERSCASCHNPKTFFTDTIYATAEAFNHSGRLLRNTPSLLNVVHNQLLMHDGRFYTLQHQVKDVIQNEKEMAGKEKDLMAKVLSCKTYKKAFEKLLPYTYTETEVSFQHVISALTHYVGQFSYNKSPFDYAMEGKLDISPEAKNGFNLFMGKANCGTCHFVPQFNGVKPPFTNSEFEVLGTPENTDYKSISPDSGRAKFFDAPETRHAFRTGTVRNSSRTFPYMHNGVLKNMDELMDFYNAGGGLGKGLSVSNQTLPGDSLHLSKSEINHLIAFMKSLNEDFKTPKQPKSLPVSSNSTLNNRKPGGLY